MDMWKFYVDTASVVAAECMSLSQHQLFISRPKLGLPWIRRESNFKDVQLGLVISASCQPRLARYEPHATIGRLCVRDQDTSL